MKKIIFLLTILCSCFILNGCGNNSSSFLTNETDSFIGEWIRITPKSFIKFKIEKKGDEYIYSGKRYHVIMEKESSSFNSPLIIEIKEAEDALITKNNFKLTETENKSELKILDKRNPLYITLKYNSKTNTLSDENNGIYKPINKITEQDIKQWAENNKKELLNSYNAKRDGEYGIIDKIDLSVIK